MESNENDDNFQNFSVDLKELKLCEKDVQSLEKQNSRIVAEFKANKLEADARKNWDLFYKRNETKFFKDRHWTTREFQELIGDSSSQDQEKTEERTLLEVGCGVGNFVFPLLQENLNLFIYCCDFSARGVQFVKDNPLYDESKVKAFECDITTDRLLEELGDSSIDIISMVFVLSAIHPEKHQTVFDNLARVLKPGK
jgi:methyltransferase-like protein 6